MAARVRKPMAQTELSDRLVTVQEAAAFLSTSRKRIYELVNDGKLVLLKMVKRQSRISETSLREFIAALPRHRVVEK